MTERSLVLILVWTMTIGVLIIGAVDLTTWWVMRRQQSQTRLGAVLTGQSLSRGVKHIAMFFFHFLLAYVVTVHRYPVGVEGRIVIYILNIVTFIIAAYYGLRLVAELRRLYLVR